MKYSGYKSGFVNTPKDMNELYAYVERSENPAETALAVQMAMNLLVDLINNDLQNPLHEDYEA